jgi:predicted dehydrogenase
VNFGLIGYGYWGPNIARNLVALEGSRMHSIAEINPVARARAQKAYPNVRVTSNASELITSPEIDAIAVISPVQTHYELAKGALEKGKHVFVEKPFTSTSAQGEELVGLALKKNLRIMVDHTFLFTGAVRRIAQLIDEGAVGNLYYYDSTRVNLGLFQHDVNVLWDLAPHDLSIMNHLIKASPEAVVATGERHLSDFEDVAYMTIYFPDRIIAHINVNWLSPVKVRTTLIGGEKRMVVWNDLEADEKVKVYDKGVEITNREGIYELLVSYRSGDMWAPRLEQDEALHLELSYFVKCLATGMEPFNNGLAGLKVVRMLEAADQSLGKKGTFVPL